MISDISLQFTISNFINIDINEVQTSDQFLFVVISVFFFFLFSFYSKNSLLINIVFTPELHDTEQSLEYVTMDLFLKIQLLTDNC